MQLIQVAIALVVIGILYARMVGRETPQPMGMAQAIVPVLLGLLSFPVSFGLTLGIAFVLSGLGITMQAITIPVLRSFAQAFFAAGFTEELAKLLLLLVAIAIFKPKNVYEYLVAGAAIGFGFTLLEEFVYGGSLMSLIRIPTIALHVVFDIIMARHLGLARHAKITGNGFAIVHYVLAFILPVFVHSLFDACTAFNPGFAVVESADDLVVGVGLLVALVATVVGTIWQVVVLVNMKKRAQEYSHMETQRLPQLRHFGR